MVISFLDFMGMRPGRTPKLLGTNNAVVALNTYLEDGSIAPEYGPSTEETLSKTGTINTLYLMDTGIWAHWTEQVNIARIPIANNDNHRVAFTGTGTPRKTDLTEAQNGGTEHPEVSFLLGLPAPADTLECTTVMNDPDGSLHIQWDIAGIVEDPNASRTGRYYVYTYVTAWGEEGPPSDPSEIVYVGPEENVSLSNFSAAPTGDYQSGMSVRIYRSVAGGSGNAFLRVDTVALPVSTYVDSVETSALGTAIPSTLWSAPPTGLSGITTMANGILAGFVGNDLYFSEPYQGHAWPEGTDNVKSLDFPIVGLASTGNMLFVLTEGYPYIVTGNHPSVLSLDKQTRAPSCVSAASIVDMGGGAVYASNEGLALISAGGAQTISQGVIPARLWKQLNPSMIKGGFYKNRYAGFYAADADIYPEGAANGEPLPQYGMFQFDMAKQEVTFSDEYGTAVFSDMISADLFYVKSDNKVYRFAGDSGTSKTHYWMSGTKVTPLMNVGAARVDARSYPVTLKAYENGVEKFTRAIADSEPFNLTSGYLGRDWSVQVSGTPVIDGVFLAQTIDELI